MADNVLPFVRHTRKDQKAYCRACQTYVPREDTHAVKLGDIVITVCKTHDIQPRTVRSDILEDR